jgi:hypothetical protein
MYRHIILALVASLGFLHAQEAPKVTGVQIRMVLHDPVNPICEMHFSDANGVIRQVPFRPKAFSENLTMLPVNGSLVFYDKQNIDPEKPMESLAATVKIPADLKRGMVVVMPAKAGEKPAYRLVLIDDSEKAFPRGESRVLSLIGVPTAVQAGEQKHVTAPGQIGKIPVVTNVNSFNMAQTNFYYQLDGEWIVFTERQLQFTNASRRLFIIHATPGALQPTITTIVDTVAQALVP